VGIAVSPPVPLQRSEKPAHPERMMMRRSAPIIRLMALLRDAILDGSGNTE